MDSSAGPRAAPSTASTSGPASAADCPIAANDLDPAITAAIPTASSPASACSTASAPLPRVRDLGEEIRDVLTAEGIRIAVFYTKVYNRLLVPLTAANQAQAPPELRAALSAITRHVDDYANRARLPRAA